METYRITVTDQENKTHTLLFAEGKYYGHTSIASQCDYPSEISAWKKGWKERLKDYKNVKVEKLDTPFFVVKELEEINEKMMKYAGTSYWLGLGRKGNSPSIEGESKRFLTSAYVKMTIHIIQSITPNKK